MKKQPIRYCRQCVNITTRPNIAFSDDGLCPVCQHFNERKKNGIDWDARMEELKRLIAQGKKDTHSCYDCIVGVSGGKDSNRQAHIIRDELGARPLLVSLVYPPEQITERGAHNISSLVSCGFDIVTISCNPQVWKTMIRRAFDKYCNWCKATEYALYASVVHMAIAYKIPLIFLGENPTYTIGESEGSSDGDATSMRNSNTLQGGDPPPELTEGIDPKDLYFHIYPSASDMEYLNVKIYYLGYFIEDFNCIKNLEFSLKHGLNIRPEPPEETGDITHSQSLDEDFYPMNQMLKYLKMGFGQVNDKVTEMINLGAMTREEGIDLVKKYDGKCHERYIKKFCDYLEISESEFWNQVEPYVNRDFFEKDSFGKWKMKSEIKDLLR